MRHTSLYEKFIEEHSKKNPLDYASAKRCVETYLHKRYSEKKLMKVIGSIEKRNDFNKLADIWNNQTNLSKMLDSIVNHKIRNAYKQNETIDVANLSDAHFITLIKKILLHYQYSLLYTPPINTSCVDIVVHRNDKKISVFLLRSHIDYPIDLKSIIDIHQVTHSLSCEQALVFSDSIFTKEAKDFASKNDIHLIDYKRINEIVIDIINEVKNKELTFLDNEKKEVENDYFFLESDIRSLRTKVSVKEIDYIQDKDNDTLTFKGILINSGKRPVENLKLNLRVYGRDKTVVYIVKEQIGDGNLDNGHETPFNCVIENITKYQWKNICSYMLKLSYRSP